MKSAIPTAWSPAPMKTIVLEKVSGTGPLHRGERFEYTYKSLLDQEALVRAHKRLRAENPEEVVFHWKKVS